MLNQDKTDIFSLQKTEKMSFFWTGIILVFLLYGTASQCMFKNIV